MKGTVSTGRLQQALGLKNAIFKNIKGRFLVPGDNVGYSAYASGWLGAGLLDKCRVIIDYARHRIAVIPASVKKSEGVPS